MNVIVGCKLTFNHQWQYNILCFKIKDDYCTIIFLIKNQSKITIFGGTFNDGISLYKALTQFYDTLRVDIKTSLIIHIKINDPYILSYNLTTKSVCSDHEINFHMKWTSIHLKHYDNEYFFGCKILPRFHLKTLLKCLDFNDLV